MFSIFSKKSVTKENGPEVNPSGQNCASAGPAPVYENTPMETPLNEDQALLDKLVESSEYFFPLFGAHVSKAITDTEKFIYIKRIANSQMNINVGDPVKPGSSTDKAMKSGQKVTVRVPATLYGTPYVAVAVPIKNSSGVVIGSIVTITSSEKRDKFESMSTELNQSVEGISEGTTNLVASSQQLAAGAAQMAENSGMINDEVKNMDSIIELIEEITRQTHLLGLNASIEAARAGELGRGFHVVADEIRKMASKTSGSVKEISNMLKSIQEKITILAINSEEIRAVSESQVSSIEEIDRSLRGIQNTTALLSQEAKDYQTM